MVAALATSSASADPRPWERGLPAVTVRPLASLGSAQLFAAAVSGARLYLATLAGLNVYDGAHWEMAASSRAVYAVATSKLGRVIAGGPDTLQELRPTPDGRRVLMSFASASRRWTCRRRSSPTWSRRPTARSIAPRPADATPSPPDGAGLAARVRADAPPPRRLRPDRAS